MFVYLSLASNNGHYLIVHLIITRIVLNSYIGRRECTITITLPQTLTFVLWHLIIKVINKIMWLKYFLNVLIQNGSLKQVWVLKIMAAYAMIFKL